MGTRSDGVCACECRKIALIQWLRWEIKTTHKNLLFIHLTLDPLTLSDKFKKIKPSLTRARKKAINLPPAIKIMYTRCSKFQPRCAMEKIYRERKKEINNRWWGFVVPFIQQQQHHPHCNSIFLSFPYTPLGWELNKFQIIDRISLLHICMFSHREKASSRVKLLPPFVVDRTGGKWKFQFWGFVQQKNILWAVFIVYSFFKAKNY